ncbi:Ig-like domain-containing protein, partial [Methanobrevibacter sp.]|uniref:Ig-like domain-containing protein n=1 Tax=Methanobrevibacter sp. TaxID=66852 RepID=UPI003863D6C8
YNRKTDDNGQACLVVNLAPGSYAVNATFAGNRYYESAFVNATVTVEKASVTLTGDDVVMSYKDGAYTVRVVDAQGNALANVVVKFTINNLNYKAKTDANGSASLKINLKPGTYPISAVVNDTRYQSETVNNTVTVNADGLSIVASDVNMTYKDGTAYEVQLVNSNGDAVALSGQIIKITANGIAYNKKTDANGIAKLTINYAPGTYELKAEYNNIEITNTAVVKNA